MRKTPLLISCNDRKISFKGFTLLELSISLAIMGIMMAVIMANYPETSMRLTLANINYKISLLAREAQIRGSSIDSGNFSLSTESPIGGYGLYFSTASTSNITLFGDAVDAGIPMPYGLLIGDGIYQTVGPDETKSITTLPRTYFIHKICVGSEFPFSCNSAHSPAITSLTISFTRPDPRANIYINNDRTTSYDAACIEIRSPRAPLGGHVRSVQVYNSGMIRTLIKKCDDSTL